MSSIGITSQNQIVVAEAIEARVRFQLEVGVITVELDCDISAIRSRRDIDGTNFTSLSAGGYGGLSLKS